MRKFTLILSLLLVVTFSYGQKFKVNPDVKPVDRTLYDTPAYQQSSLKGEGEVFYSQTFDFADPSSPRGWTLPEGWQIVDEADQGLYWTWRAGSDSIKGRYTFEPGHRFSKTPEDGYFVLPLDEINNLDGAGTSFAGPAWFQLPPIDCSAHSSVIMKLRQYFRNCCGSTSVKVSISVDQGVHWADYNMAFGTTTNVFCKRPIVEVNISDVAAGMSDVWIRFTWSNNANYFWVIDDFELSEGYKNELQLETASPYMADLFDDDQDEGFVFMTPLSQINGTLGGWTFRGAMLNAGSEDTYNTHLTTEIWKNGVSVFNESSDSRDIWPLDRDTFDITTPYFPDEYGSYKFKMNGLMDQTDGVPSNNVYEDWFHVTDSVYSISDWDFETYSSTASWGNNDGDYLGIVYDITSDCEVNSMSVFIQQRPENPKASTQVGYSFQYFVFYYDEDAGIWAELISSEWAEVTEEMINTWVTLPMEKDGESEFLIPGQYIAAIQVFHGGGDSPDNNVFRFTIGSDRDHQYNRNKTVFQLIDDEGGWYTNSTDLSMIRMNIDKSGAPSEGKVVFNVDMNIPITNGYFNPAGGHFVDVAGTFNGWTGSAHMTDADADGIYTLEISGVPVFENIEYKYRINGNWDTSEFPLGGPNRVYRTHYFSETNDVYNNGVSLGVGINELTSSMNIYPNPNNGIFTLEIQNESATNLNIQVSNLQGQSVYQNRVESAISHSETIDLTEFAAGIYFLKVNNQVKKLVIK